MITLRDAATRRLQGVERHTVEFGGKPREVFVALPVSYAKKTKRSHPLAIVLDARGIAGSAIEMARLMAQTKEIRECIVVGVDASVDELGGFPGLAHFLSQALLPWCKRYRTQPHNAVLFGAGLESVTGAMPITVKLLHADALVPSLVHGLRDQFGTGHEYGQEVTPFTKAWLMHALCTLAPAIRHLWPKSTRSLDADNPYLVRSAVMDRDYEVFASLPASFTSGSLRRYPALFVLDANIEFSTVAEAAARMAAKGECEEMVVVGIGTPRAEGPTEFGFRRFEEFSPPGEGYEFDDDLGRFFRSFFAIRGQDARTRMGRASQLMAFVTRELLPKLAQKLPIDVNDLGLLGHSAGGTFVGYALCQENSPFRRYALVSPGIAISGSWLMKDGRTIARRAEKVALCIGGEEKRNRFNQVAGIPDTEAFANALRKASHLDVHYDCYDGETHSSVFPRAVTQALTWTYGRVAKARVAKS